MKNLFLYSLLLLSSFFYAQNLNVSQFKVDKTNYSNHRIDYSYNITGTYFKVDMYLYKNSVSTSNLIAYNSAVDESNYDPIVYPPDHRYHTYSINYYQSKTPSKFILVIEAWEQQGSPKLTKTLTYIPPAPAKPDFSIGRIQIYRDKFNVNNYSHLFFDSQNTGQYPGSALNKGTKYKFVVTINNSAALPNQNPVLTLAQGLVQSGSYPNNVSKTTTINVPLSNTSSKTIEFYETIISPGQDYLIAQLAFHIDKNNSIGETNENNNLKILQTQLFPTQFTIAGKNSQNIKVFNEKGNFLKTYNNEKQDIQNSIADDYGIGNYYLQYDNGTTKRVKISE